MKPFTTLLLILIFCRLLYPSDLQLKNSVTVEIKKNAKGSTEENIDGAFIRGETRFVKENNGNAFSAIVHLRFQTDFEMDTAEAYLRQAFFNLQLFSFYLKTGRWYERYTPGIYFGRYLFGVNRFGSGSIATDYTVLDGLRLEIPLTFISNSKFLFAILPQQSSFENIYTMFLLSAKFFGNLEFNSGVNLKAVSEPGVQRNHRLIISSAYPLIKNLKVFFEYGITDLSDISNNSWIMFGADFPLGKFLDQLRLEFEYKKSRSENLSDLAWIIAIQKTWQNLTFYLNTGSDPSYFESKDFKKIGFVFRVSASF